MLKFFVSAVGLLLIPLPGGRLPAQTPPPRIPVTIVLADSLVPVGAPFVIQRRANLIPHDVILLTDDPSEGDFAQAIRTLLLTRNIAGDAPTADAKLKLNPGTAKHGTVRQFKWTSRVLSDLRGAKPKIIVGIGRFKAIEIWLPPQKPNKKSN